MRFLLPYFVLSISLFHSVLSQALNCANPADIMFLLDGSDSIDAQEWNQERNFLARMINALDISPSTINVGFTVYSSDVASHYSLTPYRPKIVLNAFARSLQHPTGIATNTAAGIEKIRETFRMQPPARRNVPKIMIVITDGSSENPAETIRQARLAKEEGVRIMSVAVGNNVFVEELEQIASAKRKFYRAADFAALKGIEKDIQNMICRVITTTMSPRITFAPPTPPPQIVPVGGDRICNNPGDIVFVIDGSDSISDEDFVRLKNFVANLVENFEIGPDAIHVGMIVYSTLVGEKIGLYPPKNKMVLKFLAKNLQHPKFGTDTALGIEAARDMISQQGRPNAPEIIIVITDGRSSNPRNTIVQAGIAKAQGMTMIAIGVGSAIFSEELTQIASGPNYVSEVTDFRALENTVNVMRNLICTSITTTSTTTTTMMPPTAPPSILPPSDDLNCKVPGDVVFLLDGSDSIKPNDWIRQRNFVANMINNLEIGQPYIHVSVIVYSSTIGEEIPFIPFNPKASLRFKVSRLPQPRFGTDTALGIQRARELFLTQGRQNAPRVMIVVTDGKSTYPENTALQANMAKADGAIMISIGIGSDVFESELFMIASGPTKVYKVLDFAALQNITRSLRDTICRVVQTTTVAPETTPVPTTTTTEMSTPMPVSLVPCIESQTAADILFLMDGSQTADPYNWMMETHFVSNFLDGLEVQQNFVHVGVVISDTVRGDTVGISPFKTRFHLKELIHSMLHPSGEMDTAAGMRKVTDIFRQQSRPGAQKILVAVTDSSSKNSRQTLQEAGQLKRDGVEILTVGVGRGINLQELRAMASSPQQMMVASDFSTFFNTLPYLQQKVCEILGRAKTTIAPPTTTPSTPGLCDGCLIDSGVGFNPYPGDCTKYVQCWKEGDTVRALIRSCPFGQFWDADAITCRPSFLVNCTADPCKEATTGFTYGMSEYGCRAYWKCLDGFSVGYCCPAGSSYVEGMGCLQGTGCNDECPPKGGLAVKPVCDRRGHWDKRYYIQIVYGRGEVVRPCPVGTIFFEDKCSCDFGMSGLLPTTPNVRCQPSAFFPFDGDLLDKSFQDVNTGRTNLVNTDLGTAYFSGRSEMNLWRFAGADWGNQLVIKFKFRFDHSNRFIDYGGLPVDLGIDFDVNMNLISDYHMTDNDWRLWTKLRNVQTLQDWRHLLQEFGQSRTFYVFLGQLGFKPGTSNSVQVMRILGTPEAYAEFRVLLEKLQPHMLDSVNLNDKTTSGLKGILRQLRSMRKLINWNNIIMRLKGDSETGGQGQTGGPGQTTGGISGNAQYEWDSTTGQWVKVSGTITGTVGTGTGTGQTNNILNIGGTDTASTWRWNSVTGQWERLAAVGGGNVGPSGSHDITITQTNWTSGPSGSWSAGGSMSGGGKFSNWQWRNEGAAAASAGAAIGATGQMGGGAMGQTGSGAMGQTGSGAMGQTGSGVVGQTGSAAGVASWEQLLKQLEQLGNMQNMQNSTKTSSWTWRTASSNKKGGNLDANREAIEALLKQLKLGGGKSGSATWEWSKTGTMTGQELDINKLNAILKQLQQSANLQGASGAMGTAGTSTGGSFDASQVFVSSGGNTASFSGGMGSNAGPGMNSGSSKRTIQVKTDTEKPQTQGVNIAGGVVVGGEFGSGVNSLSGKMSTGNAQTSSGSQTGSIFVQETSSRGGGNSRLMGVPVVRREGNAGTVVRQTVQLPGGKPGVPHTAPRGAEARGVKAVNGGEQIIGIRIPTQGDFVSGATVIGKREQAVKVTKTQPQIRITDIVQQVEPTMFEASGISGAAGGGSAGAQASWSTSGGASGGFMSGGAASAGSGMAGGDFTQMGRVAGDGGGVRRIVDTNIKQIPADAVQFNADGGVNLASLGLGGAQGANIVRQTFRMGPDGQPLGGAGGSASGGFFAGGGSSSGGSQGVFGQGGNNPFMSMNSLQDGGFFTGGGASSGGQGGNNQFMSMNTLQGGGLGGGRLANTLGTSNTMLLPFLNPEATENLFDSLMAGKKRRKRSAGKSRRRRAVNKAAYQALVTNCQGQNGKGPSIMIVANQNDVQFALKTYGSREPGIISVPAVDGWNDVTLIYDGATLTGIVENWKGFHKSSVNLSGNIERRQAGLLVGSCQGFASFHGEIDDLSVHHCLTPPVIEMRDRIVL